MTEPLGNVPQASAASGVGTKPVVLPELFTGEGDFVEWLDHFENVAAINSWDAERKLLWLKVRLTGRAQTAFKRLSSDVRASYSESVAVADPGWGGGGGGGAPGARAPPPPLSFV